MQTVAILALLWGSFVSGVMVGMILAKVQYGGPPEDQPPPKPWKRPNKPR